MSLWFTKLEPRLNFKGCVSLQAEVEAWVNLENVEPMAEPPEGPGLDRFRTPRLLPFFTSLTSSLEISRILIV